MTLYHEIAKDELSAVLVHGLVQGARGDKRDPAIVRTDEFLNTFRPRTDIEQGLDRLANIYCYLSAGKNLIDTSTGKVRKPSTASHGTDQILLAVEADPNDCYIGDLDLFDNIKQLLVQGDKAQARRLATIYWQKTHPYPEYKNDFRRPEVLVVADIPPIRISQLEP